MSDDWTPVWPERWPGREKRALQARAYSLVREISPNRLDQAVKSLSDDALAELVAALETQKRVYRAEGGT